MTIAKFRNPKNGEVYEVGKKGCCESGFCTETECLSCSLFCIVGMGVCRDWVIKNPQKAANLMGYELLTDNESKDAVNYPDHYQGKYECIDEMIAL